MDYTERALNLFSRVLIREKPQSQRIRQSDDENKDWKDSLCRKGKRTQAKEFR